MKKIWIILSITAVLAVFQAGLIIGGENEKNRAESLNDKSANISGAIAVVNMDMGQDNGGVKENYAASIIQTLDSRYTLVSANIAYNGYQNGSYGAIITFPGDVSEKILSFNSKNPEKINLEFIINPLLTAEAYIDIYTEILNLQLSMNKAVSYMYVSSIYKDFQEAQDKTAGIFKNDSADMAALENIKLGRFTESLNLGNIPDVNYDPLSVDMSPYAQGISTAALEVSEEYLQSYKKAKEDYDKLKDEMTNISQAAIGHARDWDTELNTWSDSVTEYETILDGYAVELDAYKENINHAVAGIPEYNANVTEWHGKLQEWYDNATKWHGGLTDYQKELMQYAGAVAAYRDSVSDAISPTIDEMNAWNEEMDTYYDELHESPGLFNAAIEAFNLETDNFNDYKDELENFVLELESYKSGYCESLMDTYLQIPLPPDVADYASDADYNIALADWVSDNAATFDALADLLSPVNPDAAIPEFTPAATVPVTLTKFDETAYTIPGNIKILIPKADEMPEFTETEPATYELVAAADGYEGVEAPDLDTFHEIPAPAPSPDPRVTPAPIPHDVNEDLKNLAGQLGTYDANTYLADSVKTKIGTIIGHYDAYLETANADLGRQYDTNLLLLKSVYMDYNNYFGTWSAQALEVQGTEQEKLNTKLTEFYKVKDETSRENLELLSDFSKRLPESRTTAGVNAELVDFTVQPFHFEPPAVRTAARTGTELTEDRQPPVYTTVKITLAIGGVLLMWQLLSYAVKSVKVGARKKVQV